MAAIFGPFPANFRFSGALVIGVTKVANEIYLPYLQLCEKVFFVNVMY